MFKSFKIQEIPAFPNLDPFNQSVIRQGTEFMPSKLHGRASPWKTVVIDMCRQNPQHPSVNPENWIKVPRKSSFLMG